MLHKLRMVIIHLVLLPVYLYRLLISPLLPKTCIYHPTCSAYTVESFKRHGLIRGFILSAARITRCHSLYDGGEDPVPNQFSWRNIRERYRRTPGDGKSHE